MLNTQLLHWYRKNKRDLPWRNTRNPYKIWISEIMLQQTKVDSVIHYYHRFLERFPSLEALANAEEQEVLKLWQGLGYYSRARNIHYTAQTICSKHNGIFPNNYADILQLKGIGTYTAAAISSFAYNLPYAVLDGNVFRVLARYYNIDMPIDTTQGKKLFQQVATDTMHTATPEIYNQAIIEFGALQCTPKQPKCNTCPVNTSCIALKNNTIQQLPVKSKKIAIKYRYFYYLVIANSKGIVLEKREGNDIWKNLFQYPLIETDNETTITNLTKTNKWQQLFSNKNITITKQSDTTIHKLTHQHIHINFIEIQISNPNNFNKKLVDYNKIELYPLPKPIAIHLKTFYNRIYK